MNTTLQLNLSAGERPPCDFSVPVKSYRARVCRTGPRYRIIEYPLHFELYIVGEETPFETVVRVLPECFL